MGKLSYWERRQAENMYQYMQSAEDTANEISMLYSKASIYITTQLEQIFDKYITKHNLSEQDAMRLLGNMYDTTSIDEMLVKLKSGEYENNKELLAKLEAPAYQARLERFRQLQDRIDMVMTNIYQQERVKHDSRYTDLASEAYYREIYDTHQRVGVSFEFNTIEPKTIDRIINSKWSSVNYSDRIWSNTKVLSKTIKQELLLSLVTGKTSREISDTIVHKFAQGASNARRLVRTESNYVCGALKLEAYKGMEVEKYKFLATLDLKTSTICRNLDGTIFLVKDAKVGVNYNPMHPWCRSTTIIIIDEKYMSQLTRKARNPENNETIDVPMDMTYEEWYDKYVKENPKAELAEKMFKNRSSDRVQHRKYREILGDNVPEKLDNFQRMKYNDIDRWNELKDIKQDTLNSKSFSEIKSLSGKLGNGEIRRWYKAQDEKIPNLIDKSLSIEEQARQAHGLRNQNRTDARALMRNKAKRDSLERDYPNLSFEELMKHKMIDKGMSYEQALEDIIKTASVTNKKVNKAFGLE